jgi:hypothetical protein
MMLVFPIPQPAIAQLQNLKDQQLKQELRPQFLVSGGR